MAVEVRDCTTCGAHIEVKKGEINEVNINVSKERAIAAKAKIKPIMFNAICGECRKWVWEKASQQ